MADTPFPPFMPPQASPPTQPEQPAKQTRKKKDQAPATDVVKAEDTVKVPRQKRRSAGLKSHAPKFDLQTTLAAAQSLNESDFPVFEKLVIMLDEYGKPGRDRLLAAIGKVFQ